jgi:hypothetical protein
MSGKSRTLAVAATVAGLIGMWAPAAMASTAGGPSGNNNVGLINGGVLNGGAFNNGHVNVNLGSGNTAIGNTCNNTNETGAMSDNILAWALDVSHNSCAMAGGPNHF